MHRNAKIKDGRKEVAKGRSMHMKDGMLEKMKLERRLQKGAQTETSYNKQSIESWFQKGNLGHVLLNSPKSIIAIENLSNRS